MEQEQPFGKYRRMIPKKEDSIALVHLLSLNPGLMIFSLILDYLEKQPWNLASSSLGHHIVKCTNPWPRHQRIKPFLPEMGSCSSVAEALPSRYVCKQRCTETPGLEACFLVDTATTSTSALITTGCSFNQAPLPPLSSLFMYGTGGTSTMAGHALRIRRQPRCGHCV